MWPDVVVMIFPGIDSFARIVQAGEPVEIQTIVSEFAVEALDERVLRRLARLDEIQLHFGTLRPEEHCL